MPKNNKIPDRYEDYSNMGNAIPGTRFISFKVPLNDRLSRVARRLNCPVLTPRDVMGHCNRLGLVIDLTNTTRYYDPREFTDQFIEYEKIFVEGKGVIPSNAVVKRFFSVVDNFIANNEQNDKLIGVHCTHGINRTGYLICRYMIQNLEISADQAISAFNSARGHEQERKLYLDDLREAKWINDVFSDSEHQEDLNNSWDNRTHQEQDMMMRKSRSLRRSSASPYWQVSDRSRSRSQVDDSSYRSRSRSKNNKKSNPARDYYYNYYGERSQQYDPYFYQKQGCSIGPHRPQKRYNNNYNNNNTNKERDSRKPRQYKGPRQYRSPLPEKDQVDYHAETTPFKSFVKSTDAFSSPLPISPLYMDKEEKLQKYTPKTPTGPTRNPLSPGARDDVFSPDYSRRSGKRYNPY